MNALQLAEMHADLSGVDGDLARAFIRAHKALEIINQYNHINNDIQAYLFDVGEWGMGRIEKEPTLADFGIKPS